MTRAGPEGDPAPEARAEIAESQGQALAGHWQTCDAPGLRASWRVGGQVPALMGGETGFFTLPQGRAGRPCRSGGH